MESVDIAQELPSTASTAWDGVDPVQRSMLIRIRDERLPEYCDLTPEEGRASLEEKVRQNFTAMEEVERVWDIVALRADGRRVPLRIYSPKLAGPRPTVLFFHGGGWVVGSNETAEPFCRLLANGLQAHVVAVDYSLSPEFPYPSAVDDARAAVDHLRSQPVGGSDGRLVLFGESSGGSLAAAISIEAARRDDWTKPDALMLLYPALDHRMDTPSYEEFGEGFLLSRRTMEWFWRHYLSGSAPDEMASPSTVLPGLSLPPTAIFTAEYDPLRDEGEAFADLVVAGGAPVVVNRSRGMLHGFAGLTAVSSDARAAVEQVFRVGRRLVE